MLQFDRSVHLLLDRNRGGGILEKLSVQLLLFHPQVVDLVFVIIGLLVLDVTVHGLEHFRKIVCLGSRNQLNLVLMITLRFLLGPFSFVKFDALVLR